MADLVVSLDTNAPVGERLAPEMREEITELSPSTVAPKSITTEKIADEAVTATQIAPDAVGASEIASGAVGTAEIAEGAVTGSRLAGQSVTPDKLGTGGVSGQVSGNDTTLKIACVTAAEYAAIQNPSATTLYFITA